MEERRRELRDWAERNDGAMRAAVNSKRSLPTLS